MFCLSPAVPNQRGKPGFMGNQTKSTNLNLIHHLKSAKSLCRPNNPFTKWPTI